MVIIDVSKFVVLDGVELHSEQVVREIPIPIIAIGGISPKNATSVIHAGAHGIAVISAVCCTEGPESATRGLREAIDMI